MRISWGFNVLMVMLEEPQFTWCVASLDGSSSDSLRLIELISKNVQVY